MDASTSTLSIHCSACGSRFSPRALRTAPASWRQRTARTDEGTPVSAWCCGACAARLGDEAEVIDLLDAALYVLLKERAAVKREPEAVHDTTADQAPVPAAGAASTAVDLQFPLTGRGAS